RDLAARGAHLDRLDGGPLERPVHDVHARGVPGAALRHGRGLHLAPLHHDPGRDHHHDRAGLQPARAPLDPQDPERGRMTPILLPSALLPLAVGGELKPVVFGLVIAAFLIVGILLSRLTHYEFEYVVVADYLRSKREAARRESSWIRLVDPLIRFVA